MRRFLLSLGIAAGLLGQPAGSLHAGTLPGIGSVRSDVQQQPDPKQKELTASVERDRQNEALLLNAYFPGDADKVRITLFNILGKLIEVHPANAAKQGDHTFRFLTKGLPSGPYIVILETNGQRIVNKVMVSR